VGMGLGADWRLGRGSGRRKNAIHLHFNVTGIKIEGEVLVAGVLCAASSICWFW